jgi:hypothetical protein
MTEFLEYKQEAALALIMGLAIAVIYYGSTQIEYTDQNQLPTPTPSFSTPEVLIYENN